jgi:hypothetical protein
MKGKERTQMDILLGLMWLVIIPAAYFLPTIIATSRNHRHTAAVFLTNLIFGWTFLGWAIALIWSCMNQCDPVAKPIRNADVTAAPVKFRHDKVGRVDAVSTF